MPKSAVRRLIAFLKPPGGGGAVAATIVCGAAPFAAACYGYGSHLRYGWLLALPAALVLGQVLLSGCRLTPLWWHLVGGKPPEPGSIAERMSVKFSVLILTSLSFFLGWGAGNLCRGIYCRRICARCEHVLEALNEYRSEHGAYPNALAALPNIETLKADAGITIRHGRFTKHGISLDVMDEADAVIYLEPSGYACYVPIEHRILMSFTRFHVYVRSSNDPVWQRDHIVWTWTRLEN
jgi:hypothetical protein